MLRFFVFYEKIDDITEMMYNIAEIEFLQTGSQVSM